MRILSISLLLVIAIIPLIITASGTEYTQTLPSNTILFDDFSEGLSYCSSNGTGYCNWFTQDNCGAVNSTCEVLLNNTVSWGPSGRSVEIRDHGSGSFGIEDFRRTFTYDHTHTISATFRFAFSCNMQATTGTQDVGFSLEYPDNSNPAQHQEFRVRYQPNQKQWQYKHLGIWSNIVFPSGTRAFYPGIACTGANAPHYNYGWQFVTITGQPSSNTYVTVQTPEGIWGCNGNTGLTSTCTPNNDEAQDSSCGNSNINSCMGIEMQVDGSVAGCTANQSPINACQGFLGNVLVQDVTPGQPNIVSFAVNNANYLLLSFFGLIALFAYLWPTLSKLTGHKTVLGPRGYQEQKKFYTMEEYEKDVKRRTRIVIMFLVIGAIVAAFAVYFAFIGA